VPVFSIANCRAARLASQRRLSAQKLRNVIPLLKSTGRSYVGVRIVLAIDKWHKKNRVLDETGVIVHFASFFIKKPPHHFTIELMLMEMHSYLSECSPNNKGA
jgi:hypothetical protein